MPNIVDNILKELSKLERNIMTTGKGWRIYMDKEITDDTKYIDIELNIRVGCVGCDKEE
jgi:hypothetical protein